MPAFLIPIAPGSDRGVEVKASESGAEWMQLLHLQEDFRRLQPGAFTRPRFVFARKRGSSFKSFRLMLDRRNASGALMMPRFTLEPGARTSTLLVLVQHWNKQAVPWRRVLCAEGGSDHLPDFTWNDSMGEQDLTAVGRSYGLSSPITTPAA